MLALRRFFIAAIFVGVLPLSAQLDPRLKMSTDTLDGSRRGIQGKPEVLSILDFSGSMQALVRHADCDISIPESGINYAKSADGSTMVNLGSFTGILTAGGSSTTYDVVQVKIPKVNIDNIYSGYLVRPDGERVLPVLSAITGPLVSVNGPFRASEKVSDVGGKKTVTMLPNHQWWVRQASHARLTKSGGRTIDIPIPWRVLGAPDNKPPFDAYVADPNSGQNIYFEYKGKTDAEAEAYELKQTGVQPNGGTIGWRGSEANFGYQPKYLDWIFDQSMFDSQAKPAFKNMLPAYSRAQSVKMAVLKTWVDVQNMVHWAYRYLDNINSKEQKLSTISGANEVGQSNLRSLRLLRPFKGEIPQAIIDLQQRDPVGGTPLTYALANGYAQMVHGEVFGPDQKDEPKDIAECRRHFVILFSDGEANDATPKGGPGDGDPFGSQKKNGDWIRTLTAINPGEHTYGPLDFLHLFPLDSNFNIWTLAGLAAHGSQVKDPSNAASGSWRYANATPPNSAKLSDYAPFGIKERPGVSGVLFNPPHCIKTFTVGMNLSAAGKTAMLKAAGYGHPKGYGPAGEQPSWDPALFIGKFDPPTPGKQVVDFFDTKDASQLMRALKQIFNSMGEETGSIAAPSSPTAGLKSGGITYLTTFTPSAGSPMWMGDLMMASMGTKKIPGTGSKKMVLLGKNGADLKSDQSNPVWSARQVLKGLNAANRKIYTYYGNGGGGGALANMHAKLNLALSDSPYSQSNAALLKFLGGDTQAQKNKIEWMRGNRPKDDPSNLMRMGDIINSSPVSVEYGYKNFPVINGYKPSGPVDKSGKSTFERCRVIFVGTNHGFLHAFGEISYPIRDQKTGLPEMDSEGNWKYDAYVTELWSFIPKDFLRGAYEQLTAGAGDHVFTVDLLQSSLPSAEGEGGVHALMLDGPVLAYLNENQSSAGTAMVVDSDTDKAMIVFGLGKGGRSYYAIDVTTPEDPRLAWAVIPDDEKDASANPTIASMGMSVALPSLAAINSSAEKKFKHLVFLGGGLSTDEIDMKFTAYLGEETKLGRSIHALDINTGESYAIWDFRKNMSLYNKVGNIGSIAAAPVPFDALGSYTTQRVYFTDRSGGVFCLGSGLVKNGWRTDSDDPRKWNETGVESSEVAQSGFSVRKLWQASKGEHITTSPYPFNVTLPGGAAVGLAVGSGDYWDPMDRDVVNPAGDSGSGNYSLAVVFDRRNTAYTGGLLDLNSSSSDDIKPGSSSYFLWPVDSQGKVNLSAMKNGFVVKLKSGEKKPQLPMSDTANGASLYYYEKLLTDPMVMRGKEGLPYWTMWCNIFNPNVKFKPVYVNNEWVCGGGGQTTTYRIHDVLRPEWKRTWLAPGDQADSGMLWQFRGIAGRISPISPTEVVVPGVLTVDHGAPATGSAAGSVSIGKDGVNRTGPPVMPRSWRIVR